MRSNRDEVNASSLVSQELVSRMVASSLLEVLIIELSSEEHAEKIGYETGYRYIEKVLRNKTLGPEPLEIMKFLCKEFWFEIFGKHVDKLQTNHRGVFVLREAHFNWLAKTSSADEKLQTTTALKLLRFPCGLLQGALAALGIHATVSCASSTSSANDLKLAIPLPGCAFNVKLLSPSLPS
mmetsp:Transcript_19118/g.24804  ORF Transcript_19118/g.24804 Transcript_19118/m.24804 type:complete len:181 (-) Transcript_19118:88-630(-)